MNDNKRPLLAPHLAARHAERLDVADLKLRRLLSQSEQKK